MSGVQYTAFGPWWTVDAPSLRLPTVTGRYVSLWLTGSGPPVIFLPEPGRSADWWLAEAPALAQLVTVVAVDNTIEITSAELAGVTASTDAAAVVAEGAAAAVARAAFRSDPGRPLVLRGTALPVGDGPEVRVLAPKTTEDAGDTDLIDALASLLASST